MFSFLWRNDRQLSLQLKEKEERNNFHLESFSSLLTSQLNYIYIVRIEDGKDKEKNQIEMEKREHCAYETVSMTYNMLMENKSNALKFIK